MMIIDHALKLSQNSDEKGDQVLDISRKRIPTTILHPYTSTYRYVVPDKIKVVVLSLEYNIEKLTLSASASNLTGTIIRLISSISHFI